MTLTVSRVPTEFFAHALRPYTAQVLAAVTFNYWLRFRYLNAYSEFQEPPLVRSDVQELRPDVNSPDPSTTFHNYLDDFLRAVSVFGFLKKPVCLLYHVACTLPDLSQGLLRAGGASANQMVDCQRQHIPNRSYFVVDGVVQALARAEHQPAANNTGAWGEEDPNEV